TRTPAFGPSALVTPANGLTLARLLVAPLIAVLTVTIGPTAWALWALWTVFTVSDGVDGFVARRHGITRSGAFLDPLADKFLILGALSGLAATGTIGVVPVALIALREVGMSVFRVVEGRRGISIPARPLAKVKTLVQDLAVAAAFFPPIGAKDGGVITALIWFAVALTLITGAEYLFQAWSTLRRVDPRESVKQEAA
ncbi:MAG: CDP-alcohol phosphatidyltransferase family protein, partial [Acidimicrobiales bacterium]